MRISDWSSDVCSSNLLDGYLEARRQFSTDEWIDLLIQSIGFNPQMFGKRNKLLQLIRLIPFCERNYNLIELGPKGTGKSRSEERRVGKECGSTFRSRGRPSL